MKYYFTKEMVDLLDIQGGIIQKHSKDLAVEVLERYWSDKLAIVLGVRDIAIVIGQMGLTNEQAVAIQERLLEQYDHDKGITRAIVREAALALSEVDVAPVYNYGNPSPEPRYFLAEVEQDRVESIENFKTRLLYMGKAEADVEQIALGASIISNDQLDTNPLNRDSFWFEDGDDLIRVRSITVEPITTEEFEQNESLALWVVDDEAIRRAIAYKSGATSEEWLKEEGNRDDRD